MRSFAPYVPGRALFIYAHPDDIEFVAAGTLLLLRDAGWQIHYLNLSGGDCGSMTTGPEETRAIREREGRAAAAIKLLDIVHAVEESVDVTRCGVMEDAQALREGQGCVHGKKCVTHDLWTALGRHMEDFLRRMSLQNVLDGAVDPDGQLLRPGQPLRVLIEAQN